MLLSVRNLCTDFPVKRGIVHAVEDVSFDVDAGEILAIVGESGSGKSVTSLSIMGLLGEPGHVASGEVKFEGKDLVGLSEKDYRQLRGNDMAMIFQEPMTSLNPVYRIGNQIVEAIRTHEKVGKKEALRTRHRPVAQGGHPLAREAHRRLPAPDVGRHAPARHDRHGAGLQPEAAHRRRAHHGPGRDHPGADPGPAAPPARRDRHGRASDHARLGRGVRNRRPRGCHVLRPAGGGSGGAHACSTILCIPTRWGF